VPVACVPRSVLLVRLAGLPAQADAQVSEAGQRGCRALLARTVLALPPPRIVFFLGPSPFPILLASVGRIASLGSGEPVTTGDALNGAVVELSAAR